MTHKQQIHAFLALLATMGSASATTALIDFGRADATAPEPYNEVGMVGGLTGDVALVDTDLAATGWTVSVTENGNGNGGNAGGGADVTSFPSDLVSFDAAALGDSIFANQGTPAEPSMLVLFTGLAATGSYDLILYGSRANAQGLDQRWSLTQGSGGTNVDHFSELNNMVYVDWKGVEPNANGEIEVTINSPGPDKAGALALNFASITETSAVELVSSFTTDAEAASLANPATLSWVVNEPLDSLVLDDGNGGTTDLLPSTTAGEGSLAVAPTETTTYFLTAIRGDNTIVKSLQIFSGETPEISSFTASVNFLQAGSSVDLTWSVMGATSLTLDPGGIDVAGTNTINLTPTEATTYTLTATNPFGPSTADVLVEVLAGPIPTNRNIASGTGNTNELWLDRFGNRNWTMTGATLNAPLTIASANTNITAAYTTTGAVTGGSTAAFQYPDLSVEVWFRPGALTADHQVIFETGGGQNGLAALITDSSIRLIGSALDSRNLDISIPTAGLNLTDFVQLVITNNSEADEFTVSVRDTFGNVRTEGENADVVVGVNGSGLFVWASGALGVTSNNLGGGTNDALVAPTGLSSFTGEIGIVNIYDRILETADIQAAFNRVATTGVGSSGLQVTAVSFDDSSDQLAITWNSIDGQSYRVESSTSLMVGDWSPLAGPFTANSDQTTEVLALQPDQDRVFVRVVVDAP